MSEEENYSNFSEAQIEALASGLIHIKPEITVASQIIAPLVQAGFEGKLSQEDEQKLLARILEKRQVGEGKGLVLFYE